MTGKFQGWWGLSRRHEGVYNRRAMSGDREDQLRCLVHELERDGADASVNRLLPSVYDELRSLSEAYLRRESDAPTLQATALVHEAYVRLAGSDETWRDRKHFFRTAARTMRRILVDHARARAAEKRGGGQRPVTLVESVLIASDEGLDVVVVDEALARLEDLDATKARVVELRFFGGCTIDETAEALGIGTATVERHWRFARAWLREAVLDG